MVEVIKQSPVERPHFKVKTIALATIAGLGFLATTSMAHAAGTDYQGAVTFNCGPVIVPPPNVRSLMGEGQGRVCVPVVSPVPHP
jgi:hypothetical protein